MIGLGPNLFYGSGIPACIVVMNRAKPEERKGRVLFVHGAEEVVEGKAPGVRREPSPERCPGTLARNVASPPGRSHGLMGLGDKFEEVLKAVLPRAVAYESAEAREAVDRCVDLGVEVCRSRRETLDWALASRQGHREPSLANSTSDVA